MKTVIVVPTYNEAENIPLLAAQIAASLPDAALLVMDDNSPDGTAEIAERLFASRPEYALYRVVRREGPRGLGRAYRDGFQRALRDRQLRTPDGLRVVLNPAGLRINLGNFLLRGTDYAARMVENDGT